MIRRSVVAATLLAAALPGARAAEILVKTLNSGPGGMMVFDPAFVKIQPVDTLRFMPTDRGHNAELIKGMAREGAAAFKTVVGKEETVTFEKPGLYGFKCGPHYIMGMVGLIQVGDKTENLGADGGPARKAGRQALRAAVRDGRVGLAGAAPAAPPHGASAAVSLPVITSAAQ